MDHSDVDNSGKESSSDFNLLVCCAIEASIVFMYVINVNQVWLISKEDSATLYTSTLQFTNHPGGKSHKSLKLQKLQWWA